MCVFKCTVWFRAAGESERIAHCLTAIFFFFLPQASESHSTNCNKQTKVFRVFNAVTTTSQCRQQFITNACCWRLQHQPISVQHLRYISSLSHSLPLSIWHLEINGGKIEIIFGNCASNNKTKNSKTIVASFSFGRAVIQIAFIDFCALLFLFMAYAKRKPNRQTLKNLAHNGIFMGICHERGDKIFKPNKCVRMCIECMDG